MSAKELRMIRHRLGLTQKQMAKKVGVTRQSIIKYENGEPIPQSIQNLYKLIQKHEVE